MIVDWWLLIVDYWLSSVDCWLLKFWNFDCWLLIAGSWLLVVDCWLLIDDCWVLVLDLSISISIYLSLSPSLFLSIYLPVWRGKLHWSQKEDMDTRCSGIRNGHIMCSYQDRHILTLNLTPSVAFLSLVFHMYPFLSQNCGIYSQHEWILVYYR
jgi:hypothetical protein